MIQSEYDTWSRIDQKFKQDQSIKLDPAPKALDAPIYKANTSVHESAAAPAAPLPEQTSFPSTPVAEMLLVVPQFASIDLIRAAVIEDFTKRFPLMNAAASGDLSMLDKTKKRCSPFVPKANSESYELALAEKDREIARLHSIIDSLIAAGNKNNE